MLACVLFTAPVFLSSAKETIQESASSEKEKMQEAESSEKEEKIVRVAYIVSDDSVEDTDSERKFGYGYEYLQKISYYTGWSYEYVYGSFAESLQRLSAGEVDLMGDITYSAERAEQFDYSNEIQGEEYFYLYGSEGQTDLDSSNLTTFDGIRVGVTADSCQADLFRQWCEEKAVDCETIEYEDSEQQLADLADGTLDAVVATESYLSYGWVPLIQIGRVPYYYCVARGRQDLLEELNQALCAIKEENPYYDDELRSKYNTTTSSLMRTLSEDEQQWLGRRQKIRLGCLEDYMPYCGYDAATGEASGMVIDLMDNIREQYGLDYEAVLYDSWDEMQQDLNNAALDAIFPAYGDYGLGERYHLMFTDETTTSTMTMVTAGETGTQLASVAVTASDPFQQEYAKIHYPEAEQILCEDFVGCLRTVTSGKADFTLIETGRLNELENVQGKNGILKVDLQEPIEISFAVCRGEIELLSILNKGIQATEKSLITNSLIYYSQEDNRYSVKDFLQEHALAVLLLAIGVCGIITTIVVYYHGIKISSQKKLQRAEKSAQDAHWRAEHDPLTGVYNRSVFQSLTSLLAESEQPMALLMVDLDQFKQLNDTYGHEMGDQALIKVSHLLQSHFRSEDYVIRYAGDEFVVVIDNMTEAGFGVIGEKIRHINSLLSHSRDSVPDFSVSAGVAFSSCGYDEQMFAKADEALYRAKHNGRCGCSL
jgi:diguanylate cyclase (GGDEF)-like protein